MHSLLASNKFPWVVSPRKLFAEKIENGKETAFFQDPESLLLTSSKNKPPY